ncbi:MAG: alpha/beta hydrolase [Chthoniobacteraceae bacterium]
MDKTITLVVLPGLDGTDVFFRPSLALLPAWIRPVVVSYPSSGANGYEDLFRVVREKVSQIPDFYVVGSSFSGPLAVMLAAAEPARVRGMILSATFLRPPKKNLPRFKFAMIWQVIWALRFARRIPVWVLRKQDDPFRLAKAETWARVSARCLASRVRAVLGVDVREPFKKCNQPILCIAFDDDRVVPRHNAEEILFHRPSAKLAVIPGDHLAMCKDPADWTREITGFIQEQENARQLCCEPTPRDGIVT